jgi:hypothetical protein
MEGRRVKVWVPSYMKFWNCWLLGSPDPSRILSFGMRSMTDDNEDSRGGRSKNEAGV